MIIFFAPLQIKNINKKPHSFVILCSVYTLFKSFVLIASQITITSSGSNSNNNSMHIRSLSLLLVPFLKFL